MRRLVLRILLTLRLVSLYNVVNGSQILVGLAKYRVIVRTSVGDIQGIKAVDGSYTEFTGIPYAKVDENYPFGLSTPYPKFDGVFDATVDSVMCPQIRLNGNIGGNIDCLQLNIYAPDTAKPNNLLPVMIWIYGGAFDFGSASRQYFGPKFLVRHDVILVTINYRVGPYGFMCLTKPEIPGNQGLFDQLLAFRWIYENIEAFGGSKERITLFGQSVGAMSIHMHILSPYEEIYNNVILQSGSAFTPDAIMHPDDTIPIKIAEKLGFRTTEIEEALLFISNKDTNAVIKAVSDIGSGIHFYPCLSSDKDYIEKFITDYPANSNITKIRGKSVMMGFNRDEAIVFFADVDSVEFEKNNIFSEYMHRFFNFNYMQSNRLENIIEKFYLGNKKVSHETMPEVADFMSDFIFNYPIERCVDSFLSNGVEKIYYYVFSYSGNRSYFKNLANVTSKGAVHSDEISYLFDIRDIEFDPSPEDLLIIDRMTKMWTNFAKYGDPTPVTDSLLPVKWKPITKYSVRFYLDIDSDMKGGLVPFYSRMAFWDLFYSAYGNAENNYGYMSEASSELYLHRHTVYFIAATVLLIL